MLPYVTAAEVVKICQELMAGGNKPESKNKYPVLNYTLDELKQYAGLPVGEVPNEVIMNIDDCVIPLSEMSHSAYVEFNTKDNYTFKGVTVFCTPDSQGMLSIETNVLVCYEDANKITTILYDTVYDSETGDGRIKFNGIQCNEWGE